jgi:hypothetical protein
MRFEDKVTFFLVFCMFAVLIGPMAETLGNDAADKCTTVTSELREKLDVRNDLPNLAEEIQRVFRMRLSFLGLGIKPNRDSVRSFAFFELYRPLENLGRDNTSPLWAQRCALERAYERLATQLLVDLGARYRDDFGPFANVVRHL